MNCDFCHVTDPVPSYTHYCDPFVLGEEIVSSAPGKIGVLPPYVDDGEWLACQDCHDVILKEAVERLFDRGYLMLSRKRRPLSDAPMVQRLLRAFWESRTGDWVQDPD